jgi:hypothetical protein
MTERMVESHLSIAPRVRRDFFGERNEDQLLSPLEIRIHEAVQFTGERRERRIGAHIENSNLTTSVWLTSRKPTNSPSGRLPKRRLDIQRRKIARIGPPRMQV